MKLITELFQVLIALGLINVWLIRFNRKTKFRGGTANNMVEEFATYGLSKSVCLGVGGLKLLSAVGLLVGLFIPVIALYSSAVLVVLMVGALLMHAKVHDPLKKLIPAFTVLVLCLFVSVSILLS